MTDARGAPAASRIRITALCVGGAAASHRGESTSCAGCVRQCSSIPSRRGLRRVCCSRSRPRPARPAAGAVAAALFLAWARTRAAAQPLAPVPFRRATLVALTLAAILVGAALRFAGDLARVPEVLWVDDLSLIPPALELSGAPVGFRRRDPARLPIGVARPFGTVGVLYLEGYRAALRLFGTTVFGVRLPVGAGGRRLARDGARCSGARCCRPAAGCWRRSSWRGCAGSSSCRAGRST